MYGSPPTWESPRSHMHERFRDRKRNGYITHLDLGMRYGALGVSKGHSLQVDKKSRCLLNRSLFCPIGRSKEDISLIISYNGQRP